MKKDLSINSRTGNVANRFKALSFAAIVGLFVCSNPAISAESQQDIMSYSEAIRLAETQNYTLTQTSDKSLANVVKYIYSAEAEALVPVYYILSMPNAALGKGAEQYTTSVNYGTSTPYTYSFNYDIPEGESQERISISVNDPNDYTDKPITGLYKDKDIYGIGGCISIASGTSIYGIESADFFNNKISYNSDRGGAIYNAGYIGYIDNARFIDNTGGTRDVDSGTLSSFGGAIANHYGHIGDITNTLFIGNKATQGGAIWTTSGTIDSISGAFINNSALVGGAVYNYTYGGSSSSNIGDINADFIGNKSERYGGGAILNELNGYYTVQQEVDGRKEYV